MNSLVSYESLIDENNVKLFFNINADIEDYGSSVTNVVLLYINDKCILNSVCTSCATLLGKLEDYTEDISTNFGMLTEDDLKKYDHASQYYINQSLSNIDIIGKLTKDIRVMYDRFYDGMDFPMRKTDNVWRERLTTFEDMDD